MQAKQVILCCERGPEKHEEVNNSIEIHTTICLLPVDHEGEHEWSSDLFFGKGWKNARKP